VVAEEERSQTSKVTAYAKIKSFCQETVSDACGNDFESSRSDEEAAANLVR
jgi:hypothetical protein